jgi:hypothetical protein
MHKKNREMREGEMRVDHQVINQISLTALSMKLFLQKLYWLFYW